MLSDITIISIEQERIIKVREEIFVRGGGINGGYILISAVIGGEVGSDRMLPSY